MPRYAILLPESPSSTSELRSCSTFGDKLETDRPCRHHACRRFPCSSSRESGTLVTKGAGLLFFQRLANSVLIRSPSQYLPRRRCSRPRSFVDGVTTSHATEYPHRPAILVKPGQSSSPGLKLVFSQTVSCAHDSKSFSPGSAT